MNTQDIRKAFIQYQVSNGHVVVPRSTLVPKDDPTTLFTSSGMQQLLPYLLGKPHPDGTRIADVQTCLRSQDIEDVGDNRHTTFFEMLGNWSLGDYFKHEQLPWVFKFLTETVGLDPSRLYVTCYIGNETYGIPRDTEAAQIWKELFASKDIAAEEVALGSAEHGAEVGMQGGRIFFYDGGENWWSRGGSEGDTPVGDPCGPDSEMVYEFPQVEHDPSYGEHCHPACDCGRYLEIGNSVFMTYRRTEDGFEKLEKPNVDFGGGLERIAAAAIDSPDVYKISALWPLIESIEGLTPKTYENATESMRVIADHLRAAAFLAVDGVIPSNKEQGYVMRRLIRRAIRFALDLEINQDLCAQVVPLIVAQYKGDFPEVAKNSANIQAVLEKEELSFRRTLSAGVKLFDELTKETTLTGETIFKLHDTYGFPAELCVEEAKTKNIPLDDSWESDYNILIDEQRKRSQAAAK